MAVFLKRTKPNGEASVLIANDNMSLSLDEQQRWCDEMNRYLVRQGSQDRARYFIRN